MKHLTSPQTIDELAHWMRSNCYNFDNYSINGNHIHEGYGIQREEKHYSWYYTERGQTEVLEKFDSERAVVMHAHEAIQKDRWAKSHCIGFVFTKALHDELLQTLDRMEIQYFQDKILYTSPDGYAHRTFVFGCDLSKTAHLKDKFYHAP